MIRWNENARWLCVTALLVAVCGCASIVSKTNYPVAIDSAPSGVSFFVTDASGGRVHSGTTPATVTLNTKGGYFKSQAYTIHLERPGMPVQKHAIRTGVDGWYWGNLLLGGLIGMLIVDPLTGAMYRMPPTVTVTLDEAQAQGTPGHSRERRFQIAEIGLLNAEQRDQLELLSTP